MLSCGEDYRQEIQRLYFQIQELEVQMANIPTDPASLSPVEKLPLEMFYDIFKHLNKPSLRNCRGVCSTWKNTINDNRQLMKSLTFNIKDRNVKMFMESQLATKVKSIRFQQPLQGSEEFLEEFFSKIGATVEEIILDYRKPLDADRDSSLESRRVQFSMMLRFCTKLQSLIIKCEENNYNFMQGIITKTEDVNYKFIENVTEDSRNNLTLSKIQSLSIKFNEYNLADVWQLILGLPNLRSLHCLDFSWNNFGCVTLLRNAKPVEERPQDIIFEHFRKYAGKLQEITLHLNGKMGVSDSNVTKLLLSVGNEYPNVDIKCKANLNNVLNLQRYPKHDIPTNQNTLKVIQAGILELTPVVSWYDESGFKIINIDTNRVGLCTNLSSLDIDVHVDFYIQPEKLKFIPQLKKLSYLKIQDYNAETDRAIGCRVPISTIFSSPMLSLTTLDLNGVGFDINEVSFHTSFPNLTKLSVSNFFDPSTYLNDDFIYRLTKLDKLKCLSLQRISKLYDRHFTNVHDFVKENGEIIQLPAIAGFRSLKHLHIFHCLELHGERVCKALEQCNGLEKITLCQTFLGGRAIPQEAINSLQLSGNYKVEDLPFCHHTEKHRESPIRRNTDDLERELIRLLPFVFKRFYK